MIKTHRNGIRTETGTDTITGNLIFDVFEDDSTSGSRLHIESVFSVTGRSRRTDVTLEVIKESANILVKLNTALTSADLREMADEMDKLYEEMKKFARKPSDVKEKDLLDKLCSG